MIFSYLLLVINIKHQQQEQQKTVSLTVSLYPDQIEKLKRIAEKITGSENRSIAIRYLIEQFEEEVDRT